MKNYGGQIYSTLHLETHMGLCGQTHMTILVQSSSYAYINLFNVSRADSTNPTMDYYTSRAPGRGARPCNNVEGKTQMARRLQQDRLSDIGRREYSSMDTLRQEPRGKVSGHRIRNINNGY